MKYSLNRLTLYKKILQKALAIIDDTWDYEKPYESYYNYTKSIYRELERVDYHINLLRDALINRDITNIIQTMYYEAVFENSYKYKESLYRWKTMYAKTNLKLVTYPPL